MWVWGCLPFVLLGGSLALAWRTTSTRSFFPHNVFAKSIVPVPVDACISLVRHDELASKSLSTNVNRVHSKVGPLGPPFNGGYILHEIDCK